MADVLILAINDWANTGWKYAECLKSAGVDALMIKRKPHHFEYPQQGMILSSIEELAPYAQQAKVLHYVASSFFYPGIDIRSKKIICQHGNSLYRENYESVNAFFNAFCDYAIIQEPDLWDMGALNQVYISYPVDTETIKPVFESHTPGKRIFGHFPSSIHTKGSALIWNVLKAEVDNNRGKIEFWYTEDTVPWEENLGRISLCDIYIESVQLDIKGKPFGTWGNSAVEAAALGKIVITNDIWRGFYEREYNRPCEWIIANNEKELYEAVDMVVGMTESEFMAKKQACRAQVVGCHSFKATGERLVDKIYKNLL